MNKRGNEISKKPTVSHPEFIAVQLEYLFLLLVALKTQREITFTEFSSQFSA